MKAHLICYLARVQDAGMSSLWVSLGTDANGYRLMHISPGEGTPPDIAKQFPTRTFRVNGTDPVLNQIEETLIYEDEGVTAERVRTAIAENPQYTHELNELLAQFVYADLEEAIQGEMSRELTPEEVAEGEATGRRMNKFVQGLLRGMDGKRGRDALKSA